jgi:hypothetical protein
MLSAVLILTTIAIGSRFSSSLFTHHQLCHLQLHLTTGTLVLVKRETQGDCSTGIYHCEYTHGAKSYTKSGQYPALASYAATSS